MAGYSGTPLAGKLGFKPGSSVWFHAIPDDIHLEVASNDFIELDAPRAGLNTAHVFTASRIELQTLLTRLRSLIDPAGFVWVSWPKKVSKVPTDITEDTIREVALPMGFVDVKVCAIDAIWSGLKLVIRKELR